MTTRSGAREVNAMAEDISPETKRFQVRYDFERYVKETGRDYEEGAKALLGLKGVKLDADQEQAVKALAWHLREEDWDYFRTETWRHALKEGLLDDD